MATKKLHGEKKGVGLRDLSKKPEKSPRILSFPSLLHIKPFPGAQTYQSDVESSHRLIEDALYACRYFSGAQDFLKQEHQYQNHFNFTRFNTYTNASPVQLLQQAAPHINRDVLNFKPVLVDTLFHLYKNEFRLLVS